MANQNGKKGISLKWLFLPVVLFALSMSLATTHEELAISLFMASFLSLFVVIIAIVVSKVKARKIQKQTPAAPTREETQHKPSELEKTPPAQPVASEQMPPSVKKSTKTERIHVRGTEYHTENIIAVATENSDYSLTKRELIEDFPDECVYQYDFFVDGDLVPEPDNPYDPNAIMVQANGLCIGYVPKGSTSHVRKLMQSGRIKSMDLSIKGGKYKEVYENDDGEYGIDKGEKCYSAILEISIAEE